jgi:hypothetical protein
MRVVVVMGVGSEFSVKSAVVGAPACAGDGGIASMVKTMTRAVNKEPACLNGLVCMLPPEKKDRIDGLA